MGRWLSEDPLQFGGGDLNLLAYAANDPVNNVDPSGLQSYPGGGGGFCAYGFASDFGALSPGYDTPGGGGGSNAGTGGLSGPGLAAAVANATSAGVAGGTPASAIGGTIVASSSSVNGPAINGGAIVLAQDDDDENEPRLGSPEQIGQSLIEEHIALWISHQAEKGQGNFGLGLGTYNEAILAGEDWVGSGYRVSSDAKAWISQNGLRHFRPPTFKPKLGYTQANFERRPQPSGKWTNNGHLNVYGLP